MVPGRLNRNIWTTQTAWTSKGDPIATDRLTATFEGPDIEIRGVPSDIFTAMLHGVQDVVRLLVQHLGGRDPGPGRLPQWVLKQSTIGITAIRPGSVAADLVLFPPSGQADLLDYGARALETLLNWNQVGDTTVHSRVEERIGGITRTLPEDMKLFLGTPNNTHRLELRQTKPIAGLTSEADEEALLYGWLKEVNWHNRTAQLHQAVGS